jgi:hypothetical protein
VSAGAERPLGAVTAGEELGPIDVTVTRAGADRFLRRSDYRSSFFAAGGAGQDLVPCGALGECYTDLLDNGGIYFLDAIHARCEEEYLRPIAVAEPLACAGRITDSGTTRSGMVFVDIECAVTDAAGETVFRSSNRLVVAVGGAR